jgi:ABC-type multidrug transport system ATPase subunit
LQLLTKPQILFCDEPTSGLDSFSAFSVMSTLRELSGYVAEPKLFQKPISTPSRIVLFSIHQPTSDIFHLFTNIILMNAGRIIFHGTVQEAQSLFSNMGMPCPQRYNPAEFYVNKISDPKVADDIVKYVGANKVVDDVENPMNLASETSEAEGGIRVSWMRQVVLLSHRGVLSFLHNTKHYLIELFILIVSDFRHHLMMLFHERLEKFFSRSFF